MTRLGYYLVSSHCSPRTRGTCTAVWGLRMSWPDKSTGPSGQPPSRWLRIRRGCVLPRRSRGRCTFRWSRPRPRGSPGWMSTLPWACTLKCRGLQCVQMGRGTCVTPGCSGTEPRCGRRSCRHTRRYPRTSRRRRECIRVDRCKQPCGSQLGKSPCRRGCHCRDLRGKNHNEVSLKWNIFKCY